jgi:hypothetical protein
MNVVGEAISQLQADPASAVKPSQLEMFDTVLSKLTENAKTANAAAGEAPKKAGGFLSVLKVAVMLAVVTFVLLLPPVQAVLTTMFPSSLASIGVQTMVMFVTSLLLIQSYFNA